MTRAEIARGGGFTLISIGNGWAYEFGHNGTVHWFQDDDATYLRDQWEAIETAFPDLHTTACLKRLWDAVA